MIPPEGGISGSGIIVYPSQQYKSLVSASVRSIKNSDNFVTTASKYLAPFSAVPALGSPLPIVPLAVADESE